MIHLEEQGVYWCIKGDTLSEQLFYLSLTSSLACSCFVRVCEGTQETLGQVKETRADDFNMLRQSVTIILWWPVGTDWGVTERYK